VRSARAAGSTVLFSEDMNHGRSYEGVLVRNPFSR
jgi:predicted nucleic acid-binding protein